MSIDDRPRLSGGDAAPRDRPELVSVGRRDELQRAAMVVLAAAVLVAAAVWKPWEGGRATTRDAPAVPAVAVDASGTSTGQTDTFAGLDLSPMRNATLQARWGVAVAYLPRERIEGATQRRSPTVTPTVDWRVIEL